MDTHTPTAERRLVDVVTLTRITGMSERKLRQLAIDGQIPSVKIDRLRRFDPDAVLSRLTEQFGEGIA